MEDSDDIVGHDLALVQNNDAEGPMHCKMNIMC